jgi:hypothetical protein
MSATSFAIRVPALAVLAWLTVCSLTDAQPTSRHAANGTVREIAWTDMVDQVVSIDGVAWGWLHKGIGQYVASPSQQVYLNSLARKPEEIDGRLVRVTGILRRHHMPAAPPGAQGVSQEFDYYSIDAFSVEPIERVERDQLLMVGEDWIYVGMDGKRAVDLVRARQLSEFHFAVENPRDGAENFAYVVGDGLAIMFDVLSNKVVRMWTVKFYPEGKRLNEWTEVRGHRILLQREESEVPAKGYGKGMQ